MSSPWSGISAGLGCGGSRVITLQSGVPIAVTQTTNFNAFAGFGVQRPNLVGHPTLPAIRRTPQQWFNTAAFAVTPQFAVGTRREIPCAGPLTETWTSRSFDASRRPTDAFEVRAEIFNLLNTPPFGAPAAVLGAANFGTITSAGDPRVAQLAVKFLF